jgi:hypothetical protein
MSKHHHHPHEGHHSGLPSRKPLHHDWRFYAAGALIMIALLIYLLTEDLAFTPRALPTSSAPPSAVGGR